MANYDIAENMSAQQMITQIEMAIGDRNRNDLEWMLSEYGPKIRASVGEREWRDLERRATENAEQVENAIMAVGGISGNASPKVEAMKKKWSSMIHKMTAELDTIKNDMDVNGGAAQKLYRLLNDANGVLWDL